MSETETFAKSAEAVFAAVGAQGPAWLREKRAASFATFRAQGLPTVREESWRQTDLGPLSKRALSAAQPDSCDGFAQAAEVDAWRLVFVNGHFDAAASDLRDLPEGLRVLPLAQALTEGDRVAEEFLGCVDPREDHPLIALNHAIAGDGVFVEVAHGARIERPVIVEYRSAASAADTLANPRNLIVAGKQSLLRIVEIFTGADDAAYVNNVVTEVEAADGAEVHHARVQLEGLAATHLGFIAARLGSEANFRTHAINVGGALARQEIQVKLGGERATCTLNGMYCGRGKQLTDAHTIIDHAVPNCTSYQLYKGILDDKARSVFGGRILVREDAQKTDAYQTNRALLLSDDARALSKPQLEIYADDVKCSHGATVGQLNQDQLFYLRARGIPFEEARKIMLHAFTLEALSGAEPTAIQSWGDQLISNLFG